VPASSTQDREQKRDVGAITPGALGLAILAWLVPGAGHLMLGRYSKAVVFFVVLTGMFAVGCSLDGRLFSFEGTEWLTWLSALAQWGLGLPRMVAGMAGLGEGLVTAVTYEYGNTFLMAGGLLNALVVLNVFDLARIRDNA
jgi:hypothetical protein